MSGPKTVTATFEQLPIEYTVATVPEGLEVDVDGQSFTAPAKFNWLPGSTHSISTVDLQFTPDQKTLYTFGSWSDGLDQTHDVIAPATATTYTANFSTRYELDVTVTPAGSASIAANPEGPYYPPGQVVELTATPAAGYVITSWNGVESSNGTSAQVTMSGPKVVSAAFEQLPVEFTVTTLPSGRAIIVDDQNFTGPATFSWLAGSRTRLERLKLKFPPMRKHVISSQVGAMGWPRRMTSTVPVASATYTAAFTTQYRLDMGVTPEGSGTVTSDPAGSYYNAGQTVSLTATPQAGFSLANWAGVDSSNGNTAQVTMSAPKVVTATFGEALVEFTVNSSPEGLTVTIDGQTFTTPTTVNWAPGSTHNIGSTETQTASDQKTRYVFASWSDGLGLTHAVTAPSRTRSYIATFTTQYLLDIAVTPAEGATVTSNPEGPWYPAGQAVTLTAAVKDGYTISSWSGVDSSSGSTAQVTMSGPKSVTLTPRK